MPSGVGLPSQITLFVTGKVAALCSGTGEGEGKGERDEGIARIPKG